MVKITHCFSHSQVVSTAVDFLRTVKLVLEVVEQIMCIDKVASLVKLSNVYDVESSA